jgi:ABC-type sugar transport system ATPase subunit
MNRSYGDGMADAPRVSGALSKERGQLPALGSIVGISGLTSQPYFRASGITKSFGLVRALKDVNAEIREGEVLAIVGDNGAGKSTLTNILSGVVEPDLGDLFIAGKKVRLRGAAAAQSHGVATVYQTLALVNCRDVASNLLLGREPTVARIFIDRARMLREAHAALSAVGVHIPNLSAEVGELSGGQRQCIAIARATAQNGRIIIMDEPTAALGVRESARVLDLILHLRSIGRGVIIISHNMHHVFSVADRIMVLRRGAVAGVREKSCTTPDEIIGLIVGRRDAGSVD